MQPLLVSVESRSRLLLPRVVSNAQERDGGPVTPDLGHPGYVGHGRDGWGNHTVSHHTVMVDAREQLNREPGYLSRFAVTPTVQALQVHAPASYRCIRVLTPDEVQEHYDGAAEPEAERGQLARPMPATP